MYQIKDIKPLNEISFFPLAIGYWLLLFIIIFIAICYFLYQRNKESQKKQLKIKNKQQLLQFRESINRDFNIDELFIFLKIIALQKFDRNNCASLSGKKWLEWLDKNDKNSSNWLENGKELVKIQFASKEDRKILLKKPKIQENIAKFLDNINKLL